jgi:hypothetical protein
MSNKTIKFAAIGGLTVCMCMVGLPSHGATKRTDNYHKKADVDTNLDRPQKRAGSPKHPKSHDK